MNQTLSVLEYGCFRPDLKGYVQLLRKTGFKATEKEDFSEDFARHCHTYQEILRNKLKDGIIRQYEIEMFEKADEGIGMWVKAADEGKAGRGRLIGRKTSRYTQFSV